MTTELCAVCIYYIGFKNMKSQCNNLENVQQLDTAQHRRSRKDKNDQEKPKTQRNLFRDANRSEVQTNIGKKAKKEKNGYKSLVRAISNIGQQPT